MYLPREIELLLANDYDLNDLPEAAQLLFNEMSEAQIFTFFREYLDRATRESLYTWTEDNWNLYERDEHLLF